MRALHKGDEVVTYGGIIGRIVEIDAERGTARLEIAEGVTITLLTAALQQVYNPDEIAYNARIGISKEAGEQASPYTREHEIKDGGR